MIQRVKAAIPDFKKAVSRRTSTSAWSSTSRRIVTNSIRGLVIEGLLGAVLTGLMVLLFLRDWRSALIVIIDIPFALLARRRLLWATGQTINIMTLGGLALAVGVLVDEATVEIENIHTHMLPRRLARARRVEAAAAPPCARLLSMFCILAVFVPSFFMVGVGRQLFVPLSLAVGFSMIASYLLSSTLVPVFSTWLMREGSRRGAKACFARASYDRYLRRLAALPLAAGAASISLRRPAAALCAAAADGDRDLSRRQRAAFQLRLRAPAGTRIEETERIVLRRST